MTRTNRGHAPTWCIETDIRIDHFWWTWKIVSILAKYLLLIAIDHLYVSLENEKWPQQISGGGHFVSQIWKKSSNSDVMYSSAHVFLRVQLENVCAGNNAGKVLFVRKPIWWQGFIQCYCVKGMLITLNRVNRGAAAGFFCHWHLPTVGEWCTAS